MRYRRFGRTTAHRKAMFKNMVASLLEHERIVTTTPKAKELRRYADRVITLGRKQSQWARAEAERFVRNKELHNKLFTTLAERYKFRPTGFTRILKIGPRKKDAAHMSVIELVDREGELRKAKPCDEDTLIRYYSCNSVMYRKKQFRPGGKQNKKAQYMIDLMNELKRRKAEAANNPEPPSSES